MPDEVFTLFYIFEIGWDSKCREGGGGTQQEGPARRARLETPNGERPFSQRKGRRHDKGHSILVLKMDSDDEENRAFPSFPMAIVRGDQIRHVSEGAWEHHTPAYEVVDNREFYLQNCALELKQRFVRIVNRISYKLTLLKFGLISER